MPDVQATVVLMDGEFTPTTTGKDRWTVHTNDGREFGIWDEALFNAVSQHYGEDLLVTCYSKQADNGRWWNTITGAPGLGIKAADNRRKSTGGTPAAAGEVTVDLSDIVPALDRIAQALENMVAFMGERMMRGPSAPDEPPDA